MNALIQSSLERGLSYQSYRELMKRLVADRVQYTLLNHRRMKRWDKTIKVAKSLQKKIAEFNHPTTWLVISESWCGDAAHVLPAINKIAELNDNIDVKVVLRDENPELMDAFLTNGAQSVPKVIIIDNETNAVLNTYGPRPSEATSYVNRFKAKYGKLTPEFKEDLQHWYNKDKGQNVLTDVTEMLCRLEPSVCQ